MKQIFMVQKINQLFVPPVIRWGTHRFAVVRRACVRVCLCVCACVRGDHFFVNATPPTPLVGISWNFATMLGLMCSCAWRQEFSISCSVQKLWPFDIFIVFLLMGKHSCQRNSSNTTGVNFMKVYHNAWPHMWLCVKAGIHCINFSSKVMALSYFH